MSRQVILGPPGTGKTTHLLSLVDRALQDGVLPSRIGFLAFTKKAASEAVSRAVVKFNKPARAFPYFRTLHSLAYQQLGLGLSQVMGREAYKDLGKMLGMDIQGYINPNEGLVVSQTEDDRLVFIENLSRVRCIPLQECWKDQHDSLRWSRLEQYAEALKKYKAAKYVIDYTDMIEQYVERCDPPELDYLFIDEAQDLAELQWRMVDKLITKSKNVVIAGDDDQSIYNWAGASTERFLNVPGDVTVLEQSYRIPRKVYDMATSVSSRIRKRYHKTFHSKDEEGAVTWYPSIDSVDLSQGEWLVLARNKYLLSEVQSACDSAGYNYTAAGLGAIESDLAAAISLWAKLQKRFAPGAVIYENEMELLSNFVHKKNIMAWDKPWEEVFTKVVRGKRERISAMLRRGEDISKPPRIKLSTIHGAKGGEADNVLLITDVSYKAFQEYKRKPDDELRVLYVAMTRAKKHLHLLQPATTSYFEIY